MPVETARRSCQTSGRGEIGYYDQRLAPRKGGKKRDSERRVCLSFKKLSEKKEKQVSGREELEGIRDQSKHSVRILSVAITQQIGNRNVWARNRKYEC